MYFGAVHNDNAGNVRINIPVVGRYNLYAFMWDKFGYRPHEVDELDVGFIRAMTVVASADSKAQRNKMENQKVRKR